MSLWGTLAAGFNLATDAFSTVESEVNSPSCRVCRSFFSLTVRRHRCRACLECVCGACSQDSVDLDGDGACLRVCGLCFERLDSSGLVGQRQSRSRHAPAKSKYKLTLEGLRFGAPALPGRCRRSPPATSESGRRRDMIFDFTVGDKLINSLRLTPEKMSLSFEFRADVLSPLESFVLITASDSGRPGGELARCRIILSACSQSPEGVTVTHAMVSKDRTFPIELTTHLELVSAQPRETEKRPPLRLEVPMAFGRHSAPISFTPGDVLYLHDLFPPTSALFKKLFHCGSRPHISHLFGDSDSDSSVDVVIPSNELVMDIIDDCWVNASAASMLCGVLLLTSHRLVFIEYAARPGSGRSHDAKHSPVYIDRMSMSASIFFIPIACTAEVIIRRFIQKHYHGLEVLCKDGVSCIFRFRREAHNDMTLLEKFRRVKLEMLWRREEDAFGLVSEAPAAYGTEPPRRHSKAGDITMSPGMLLTERSEDDMFVYVGADGRDLKDPTHSRRSSVSEDVAGNSTGTCGRSVSPGHDNLDNDEVAALRSEYERLLCMGQNDKEVDAPVDNPLVNSWRISEVNKYYAVCASYPPILVVPECISDEHMIKVSRERSTGRVPALTWVHPTNGASLTRSSQPMIGINVTACPADEKLLMCIRESAVTFRDVQRRSASALSPDERDGDDTPDETLMAAICPELVNGPVIIDGETKSPIGEENRISMFADSPSPPVLSRTGSADEPQPTVPSTTRARSAEDPVTSAAALRNISIDEVVSASHGGSPRTPSVEYTPPTVNGDAALTKIGGLMQGFRGTQSVMLRDKEYHRAKNQLHKCIDMKGVLTFQRRTKLRVVDCRPLLNAKGNVLMGKGHEVIDRLGGSKCTSVEFANIANIHGVRESYTALRRTCFAASQCGSNNNLCTNWNLAIHESKWMQHLSSILYASASCAVNLQNGDPVLVHCSDGWDRTSQVAALAQLLIDPFYRTIQGFCTLVNKDFVWFGHRFRARSGSEDVKEQSPVFLQFMDCVWQIWRQFPWEFEFNEKLLLVLLYAQCSRFSTDFYYENFRERVENEYHCYAADMFSAADEKTPRKKVSLNFSIWDHVKSNVNLYKNLVYINNSLHEVVKEATRNLSTPTVPERRGTAIDEVCEDDFSTDGGSSVISEEAEGPGDSSFSPHTNHSVLCGSVPDMISAAIKSDLVNERASGSIVAKASFSESMCVPRLTGLRPSLSRNMCEVPVDALDSVIVPIDPLEVIQLNATEKQKRSADMHAISGGHALLSVDWSAEQQGGPVAMTAEDLSGSVSMSMSSAPTAFTADSQMPKQSNRTVRLIIPLTSVPSLALWEAAHMLPGIPFSSSVAGNSSALERGMAQALHAEKDKSAILEQQLRDMTTLLQSQGEMLTKLEEELHREKIEPADADTVIINSSGVEAVPAREGEEVGDIGWGWSSISRHPAVVATTNVIRNK